MRVRAPQILMTAALLVVGYLVWDGVVAPMLETGGSRDIDAELAAALEAEGEATTADGGPTLSGRGREGTDGREGPGRPGAGDPAGLAPGGHAGPAEIRFKGRVIGANGRPASEVRIVVRGAGGAFEVVTDEEGRFDRAARPGRYALLFDGGRDGGLVVRSYMLDGAPKDDLEFELREPAALRVKVQRGDEGVSGTALVLESRAIGEMGRYEGTTDVDGVATFEGLPPGPYELTAEVPEGPRVRHRMQAKASNQAEVNVRIPDGVTIKGVVRAGPDGPGVAGATLTLHTKPRSSHGVYETIMETGPDGAYEVVVPKGRPHVFLVEATGFAPWPTLREQRKVLRSLRGLDRGKSPVTRNVVLRGGAALSGLVTTDGNEPLPGIALRVKPRRGPAVSVTTGEDGRYAVAHLNPGRHRVQVETEAYFPVKGQITWVFVPGGLEPEPQVLDLVLVPARRLEGVVMAAGSQAAPGARVWIVGGGIEVRSARDAGRVLETFTDAAGRWAISDIPPDKNVVVRAALGLLEADPFPAPWRTPPALPITLRLKDTGTLRGIVQDLVTREPVRNARVKFVPTPHDGRTGRNARTDAEGKLVLEGMLPGGWQATPSKTGYLAAEPTTISVSREGETTCTLDLDPGEIFAGIVVDDAGQALPAVRVAVRGVPDGEEKTVGRSVTTKANGAFRLTGLKRGVYVVRAWRKGFRSAKTDELRGGAGALRLVLRRVAPR